MQYDNELIKKLKDKNFGNFWSCFDYLTLASYTPMASFDMSMKIFGEEKLFENVGFIRGENITTFAQIGLNQFMMGIDPAVDVKRHSLTIGVLSDEQKHLQNMFITYGKWLAEGKFAQPQADFEEPCEIITVTKLNNVIFEYIDFMFKKQRGYGIFIPKNGKPTGPPTGLADYEVVNRLRNNEQ